MKSTISKKKSMARKLSRHDIIRNITNEQRKFITKHYGVTMAKTADYAAQTSLTKKDGMIVGTFLSNGHIVDTARKGRRYEHDISH